MCITQLLASPLLCPPSMVQTEDGKAANGHAKPADVAATPSKRRQPKVEQQAVTNGSDGTVTVGRSLRSGKVVAYAH